MVSSPSYPDQPSPSETASAQTSENVASAIANNAMNKTNQVDAQGNTLTYKQTGTTQTTDAQGKVYDIPTYTAYQAYSPENQKIFETTQNTQGKLATIGNEQTSKIGDLLSTNVDLSAENIDKYSNDHWKSGFDRTWNQSQAALDQKLANQGIMAGSAAYSNAYGDFTKQKQAAEDQYLGDMYNRSQAAILQARNQPINEISALMSGSQIAAPSYASTQTSPLPTTDYAGIEQNWYANEVAKANAQAQANNSLMGGLFGLGGTLGSAFILSDRRMKTDISWIGTHPIGVGLYSFRYLWGGPEQIGVMSDEVRAVRPDAVIVGADGFDRVNYAAIGGV